MLKMFRYLRPYLWQCLLLIVAVAVQAWGVLQLPTMMSQIVNEGIVTGDTARIWQIGGEMVVVALIAAGGALISSYESAKVGAAVGRDMRNDFFAKVMSFSTREIDDFSTASLITRTTNDINIVQQTMIQVLSMMLRVPMMAIGALIAAVALAPDMTWIIALAVGILLVTVVTILSLIMPKFKIYQKLQDRINLETRESLTGLKVIRAFNNERQEEKKFGRTNEELRKVDTYIGVLFALQSPLMTLVFNGASMLCIWIGVINMQTDASYLGKMMAFMQYATQVIMSFMFLIVLFVTLPRGKVSAERINEIMRKRPAVKWKKREEGEEKEGAGVEFRRVGFSYGRAEEEMLSDISFKAPVGQTTALIGATGSGKTTMVNLMMRFYDATSGQVLVGGRDVKDYSEEGLAAKIGYVPQRAFLFSGTVKSNILYGVDTEKMSEAEAEKRMREAARVAQAEEFIEKLPKKYEEAISEGGTNVSGGQRQRLSIARAIAKKPEVYIFDDAFSALDMKTDRRLRAALEPVTKEAAVIIVAQRISTIRNAEQIIVIDGGKIVGKGRHEELMRECRIYQEIAKSQLSEEEYKAEMENGKAKAGVERGEAESGVARAEGAGAGAAKVAGVGAGVEEMGKNEMKEEK